MPETVYLRIDPAPVFSEDFSFDFENWLSQLESVINQFIYEIEDYVNGTGNGKQIDRLTQAEIVALGPNAENGTMWYCTDSVPPNIVVKINGSLRQITHAAFP